MTKSVIKSQRSRVDLQEAAGFLQPTFMKVIFLQLNISFKRILVGSIEIWLIGFLFKDYSNKNSNMLTYLWNFVSYSQRH